MKSEKEQREELNGLRKMEFKSRVDDLNALKKVFGEKVEEIVLENRGKAVEKDWRGIAESIGKNDIQGLKDTLWKWVSEVGFEFTYEETEEGTQFTVTKCPIADMAKELHETRWGYICYCSDDPHIVKGYNPTLEFKRTKTLMEGHDCCNHCYLIKK